MPVTFAVFTYERVTRREIPVPSLAVTFPWGGALGLIMAGVLEYQTARRLGLLPMIGAG